MSFYVKNASGNRCSLAYCTSLWSHNDQVHISFFKFPKDHSRCASWIENCEAKYLPTTDLDVLHKTYKLCSLHFQNEMFVNMLKNRLSQSAIPTIFAKKPVESQDNSFVDPQNTEISNVLSENSLMADAFVSIDDQLSCSTPDTSSMLTLFNASTSTEIFEANACSQTPGFLSTKTPRKVTLRKKLAEAHTTIKPLENDVNHLTMCPQQADTIENAMNQNGFSTGEEDSRGPIDKICCLQEDGFRCQRQAGNASYSKKIRNTVRQLKLHLDAVARHIYICDYHKNMIQSARSLKPSSQDETPEVDFSQLQMNTLRRYKKHYKVVTKPSLNKAQMAESLLNHFKTISVNEKEALTFFIYTIKTNGNKLDQKNANNNSDTM